MRRSPRLVQARSGWRSRPSGWECRGRASRGKTRPGHCARPGSGAGIRRTAGSDPTGASSGPRPRQRPSRAHPSPGSAPRDRSPPRRAPGRGGSVTRRAECGRRGSIAAAPAAAGRRYRPAWRGA